MKGKYGKKIRANVNKIRASKNILSSISGKLNISIKEIKALRLEIFQLQKIRIFVKKSSRQKAEIKTL